MKAFRIWLCVPPGRHFGRLLQCIGSWGTLVRPGRNRSGPCTTGQSHCYRRHRGKRRPTPELSFPDERGQLEAIVMRPVAVITAMPDGARDLKILPTTRSRPTKPVKGRNASTKAVHRCGDAEERAVDRSFHQDWGFGSVSVFVYRKLVYCRRQLGRRKKIIFCGVVNKKILNCTTL